MALGKKKFGGQRRVTVHYLRLYLDFIKISFLVMFEKRSAFILSFSSMMLSYAADICLLYIMIDTFKTIGSWGPYEVMLLYALNLISYSLAGFFLNYPCTRLAERIRTGQFDEVLTKPLHPFLYLICRDFNPGYISHISLSFVVIFVCIAKLGIELTLVNIGILILIIISSTLIQGALFILTAVPAFWFTQTNSLMNLILFELKLFIRYPISIYHKGIQIFLTVVIPYAFINFFPAQILLKKQDFLLFPSQIQYFSPIVGIVLFTLAYRAWSLSIKKYASSGS